MSGFKVTANYDAIGSLNASNVITPATLTAAYTGNTKTLVARYQPNIHLDIQYTPANAGAVLYILLELSNDPTATGGATNFDPLNVQVAATTEIDIYDFDPAGSVNGTPLIFPKGGATVVGTLYKGTWDGTVVCNYVKVSVKEVGAGAAFGTCYLRFSCIEN